jgi:hypothetical protein
MCRVAFVALLVLAAPVARATDLPTGTWSVNVDGKKGELVIKQVGEDKNVKLTLFGVECDGTWDGGVLTFRDVHRSEGGTADYDARLVSEPAEKGQTKYTLVGTRTAAGNPPPPGLGPPKAGWYAQITVKPPAGQIKVEVKGTLVCKDTTSAYVSVKQENVFGKEEETRIYFRLSEGEWKEWRHFLPQHDGEAVTVTGSLGQIPTGHKTSIPEGAMYFLKGFEIKTATGPLK